MRESLQKLLLSDIQVDGLFRDLLSKQSNGLTGHMEEVFPDVSNTSAWLGGDKEQWERGPYYLDGLLPLAYLTHDEFLLKKTHKWIDSILASQRPDGFFGPKGNEDWWPRFVALKALTSYAEMGFDARILPFMERFFLYLDREIEHFPLDFWAYARGLEAYEALEYVYRVSKNPLILNLLAKLQSQTLNWQTLFETFPYTKSTNHYLNKTFFSWIKPILAWLDARAKSGDKPLVRKTALQIHRSNQSHLSFVYLTTHGVNLAMALKYVAYTAKEVTQEAIADRVIDALDTLLRYHGSALGIFSGDEHLNGTSPTQGVELCTIVELMYSLQEIVRLTHDARIADRLEYFAFNAMPATFSHDLCSHQYFQQTNQAIVSQAKRHFFDAGKDANLFGVAPNFGCCAANLHQGWPKFVQGAVLQDANSIWVMQLIAGRYTVTTAAGSLVLVVSTHYPFEDSLQITIEESQVTAPIRLHIRLPHQCTTTVVSGGIDQILSNQPFYEWESLFPSKTRIAFHFDFMIQVNHYPKGSFSIRRGGLLFAHRLQETEESLQGTPPFHDRCFTSTDDVRVVPKLFQGSLHVLDMHRDVSPGSFYDDKFELVVEAAMLSHWPMRHHSLANLGTVKGKTSQTTMTLVPYGQTILRVAQFPTILE